MAILGVLLLGFGGAGLMYGCGSGELAPGECTASDPDPPVEDTPTACAEPTEKCRRFFLPLLGDLTDPALRTKYKAKFGSACYVSEANTFGCFYKEEEIAGKKGEGDGQGCKDAQMIADIYGAASYDEGYKCEKVPGTDFFSLQVGPDPAIKINIHPADAPLETSLIDVDGGAPIAINGPYRNLVEMTTIKPGKEFNCTSGQPKPDGGSFSQKDWILQINLKAHGMLRSDLAGYEFPCKKCGKLTTCTEKTELKAPSDPYVYDPEEAQVHHVARAKDLRSCDWGTNANKNAVVISGKLNQHLKNKYPSANEVN